MSIFDWFSRTRLTENARAPESAFSSRGVDATEPMVSADRLRVKQPVPPASTTDSRKTERHMRRELLYSVVRDSMIRAGVLAASYKFKVLSIDAPGRKYLVMMDLTNQSAGDPARLAEIEAMMAHAAKLRHDILITAVYWRVKAQVTAGLSSGQWVPSPQTPRTTPAVTASLPAQAALAKQPPYEPLEPEEMVAFKRALTSAAPTAPHGAPPVEFEDTRVVDPDERLSPLSGTQYGDLN